MKAQTYDITPVQAYAARAWLGDRANHPVVVVGGNYKPRMAGGSYYWTTPSGKTIVRCPNSYGWPISYHPSTLHIVVGRAWLDCMRPEWMRVNGSRTMVYRRTGRTDARGYTTIQVARNYRLATAVLSPDGKSCNISRSVLPPGENPRRRINRRSAIAQARRIWARAGLHALKSVGGCPA